MKFQVLTNLFCSQANLEVCSPTETIGRTTPSGGNMGLKEHKKKLEKHRFKVSDTLAKAQIELIIKVWLKNNQSEAKEWALDLEQVRQEMARDTASSKSKTIRYGARIPFSLLKAIEKQFPDVFRDKNQFRWFMKTFRIFTIPKKL